MTADTKTLATAVPTLLRSFGQRAARHAIANYYPEAMSLPIDLSLGDKAAEPRGELMRAFGRLINFLEKESLQQPEI